MVYERNLANLIAHTKKGELYGEWNDYGRLLDYLFDKAVGFWCGEGLI